MKIIYALAIIFVIILGYFLWQAERKLNYYFSYQSQVEATILKKVKPECLIKEKQ